MIVDDHELMREALRLAFEGTEVDIVAEAGDGLEAFDQLRNQSIDVALVDITMPHADGYQFLEMVREARLKFPVVLMHSVHDGAAANRRCQELGAKGLLQKGRDDDQLLQAVRSVHAGRDLWDAPASECRKPDGPPARGKSFRGASFEVLHFGLSHCPRFGGEG